MQPAHSNSSTVLELESRVQGFEKKKGREVYNFIFITQGFREEARTNGLSDHWWDDSDLADE